MSVVTAGGKTSCICWSIQNCYVAIQYFASPQLHCHTHSGASLLGFLGSNIILIGPRNWTRRGEGRWWWWLGGCKNEIMELLSLCVYYRVRAPRCEFIDKSLSFTVEYTK